LLSGSFREEVLKGLVGFQVAMAGAAIEAVKFKMLVKSGQADEALESGFAHLGDVLEFHVICNEGENLRSVVIREAQALANCGSHFHAHFDVAIEANAVSGEGRRAKCGRFADVMKEDAPGERRGNTGGEFSKHEAGMNPNVALGMILGRLQYTFHGGDFGQKLPEKAGIVQEFEGVARGALREKLGQFFADAFGGDDVNLRGKFLNRCECGGFDGIAEASGKTNCAQHAQFVLRETSFGLADGANDPGLKIVLAANIVEDLAGIVAHQQTVDGEVAAGDIFLWSLGVDHAVRMPTIGVTHIRAKRGNFNLALMASDENNAELRADSHASGEKLQDALGSSVGGHVDIGGLAIEENISHTAANEQRLVSVADQRIANRFGKFAGIHGLIMRQGWRRTHKN